MMETFKGNQLYNLMALRAKRNAVKTDSEPVSMETALFCNINYMFPEKQAVSLLAKPGDLPQPDKRDKNSFL